jgi:Fe-S-cluster-containing dehydrogenase component
MRHEPSMIHEVLSCQHCVNPPCLDACQDGAMSLSKSGVVVVNELVCTGCMRCVKACAFSPPRINMVRSRSKETRGARKCDLCSGRADGPACIQWCPVKCLGMSDGPRPEYEAIHAAFMGAESAGAGAVETGETRDPDILGELIVAGEEASK